MLQQRRHRPVITTDGLQRYAGTVQHQQQLLGVVGLIAVLDRYADFYRELMLREEQQMLPLLHTYLSPQDWAAAHAQMLVKEKAFTRTRDALAAERRRMPRPSGAISAPS